MHHTNGPILKRAIKDFGHKMVSESKNEVIDHFAAKDLDEVADIILSKASDDFLDKALAKRLGTIDARSLINALARAERLGYENSDVVDEKPTVLSASTGHLPPALPGQTQHRSLQPATPQAPPQQTRGDQASSEPATQNLQCPLCWRKFASVAPYQYVSIPSYGSRATNTVHQHVKKQLCTKAPPTSAGYGFLCEHCGAGFITNVGQQYVSQASKWYDELAFNT